MFMQKGLHIDCLGLSFHHQKVVNKSLLYSFPTALKSGFLLIFSVMLASSFFQQILDKKIETALLSNEGINSSIWLWGGLSMLLALFFPLLIGLFCSYFLSHDQNKKMKTFIADNVELSFIESLRAWGKSFLWFFVFIIPGFVKYVFYFLTPYVVYFSRRYKLGDVDALQLSEEIFKKNWLIYLMLIIIFTLILPALLASGMDEYRLFAEHPVSAVASVLLETVLILFFHYLILKKMTNYLEQKKDLIYVTDV